MGGWGSPSAPARGLRSRTVCDRAWGNLNTTSQDLSRHLGVTWEWCELKRSQDVEQGIILKSLIPTCLTHTHSTESWESKRTANIWGCSVLPNQQGFLMRNYIKKGGHGGKRVGAGLKAGHWDEQGGRKRAAEAKKQSKAAAQAR